MHLVLSWLAAKLSELLLATQLALCDTIVSAGKDHGLMWFLHKWPPTASVALTKWKQTVLKNHDKNVSTR